tara:strand:- start:70 stop:345 length:276 start_codon:yes stop_codon:yes gene_type:complete
MATKTKTKAKATEEKGEKESVKQMPQSEEVKAPEENPMTEEQYKEMRVEAKKRCGEELRALLEKYGCELKAQLTLTEHGNTSQVFIVDARS